MSIKKPVKKVIKKSLEVGEEFVKEAKRQITTKTLPAEELLGSGPVIGQKQAQQIQQREEDELGKVRMEKAKMLSEWRQRRERMERGIKAIVHQKEWGKEEKNRREEEEDKKQKTQPRTMASGESAIAATGSSKKRPMGLFGLGKGKKSFKWSSERKGRSPK